MTKATPAPDLTIPIAPPAPEPAPAPEPEDYLTVAEVAAVLRVHKETVRRWINAGKLPAVRISSRDFRVPRAEYDKLVAQLRTSQPLVIK